MHVAPHYYWNRLFTCHLNEYKIPAVVECSGSEVRLVGGGDDGSYNNILDYLGDVRGLINVCEDQQWNYICDADWTMEDASVACRELGYAQPGCFLLLL